MKRPPRLLLASTSPRRAALLTEAGIAFEPAPPDVDEASITADDAVELVTRRASAKAAAVARRNPGRTVLGADTEVMGPSGKLLGQPADRAEAAAFLASLAGEEHRVLTGYRLLAPTADERGAVETRVRMRALTAESIEAYLDTGEWAGKAGAYAIQGEGRKLVDAVDGSFSNVVGLPMERVMVLLRKLGF